MADNDKYNDEYQFADLDAVGAEPLDYNQSPDDVSQEKSAEKLQAKAGFAANKIMWRNALIVISILVLIIIVYPFIKSLFSTDKKQSVMTSVTNVSTLQQNPIPTPIQPTSVSPVIMQAPVSSSSEDKLSQKLTSLELNQRNMRSDIASTNNQLDSVNKSIDDMMKKITELNQVISQFTSKAEEHARELERLRNLEVAWKKAHMPRVIVNHVTPIHLKYYIQAAIPGRAWLIASNGATLTVREGTPIAGLGIVKLIDARQGRVLTSSGQVIRFSQEDS